MYMYILISVAACIQVAFSSDSTKMLVAFGDRNCRLYDVGSGELLMYVLLRVLFLLHYLLSIIRIADGILR